MDISFRIQRYTEAETLEEWVSIQQKKLQVVRQEEEETDNHISFSQKIIILLGITLIIGLIILNLADNGYSVIFYCWFALYCSIVLYNYSLKSTPRQYQKETEKSFEYFGEMIHFEDIKIRISSPLKEQKRSFLHKDLQDFVLCHKPDVTLFKWKTNTVTYQYTIYSNQVQRDLIQVLEHLYAQNIPVREIDELGRKLNLLELVDKPLEKKTEIDEKIQRLIDEIGEK